MILFCLFALMACLASAADSPRIFYSKSFPGSHPAYVEIIVEKNGQGVYKEAPDDAQPLRFQLTEAECQEIFALAEKLDRFSRPLEANVKVANMGMKTLRFEDGKNNQEVKFNYTMDLDGRTLTDWFERITETELHMINLERAARFDKLGVDKALLLLEVSVDRKRLVAAEQFLPILDRIFKNHSYLDRARDRAARLAEYFRSGVKAE